MSHIVTIQTRIHDLVAITATCKRLGLAVPTNGTAKLFSGDATGLLVQLPGWQYPVVIDTLSGTVRYDNFEGRWGDQALLNKFLQIYAVEKAKQEARKKNLAVTEQTLEDGSIRLQITEGS
jgi:hypothetical protein